VADESNQRRAHSNALYGGRAFQLLRITVLILSFVSSAGALLALKLSRKLSVHAVALCSSCAHHAPPFTAKALRAEAAAYATLARSSTRKLSVHAVALCSPCAHHVPHYTAQALRARSKRAVVLPHAFGLPAFVAGWTWCATRTTSAAAARTATTTMHSPAHRRLRKALRRQQCTVRLLFTWPAWPRHTLRSHDDQRAPRKLSAHAVALCLPCSHHVSLHNAHVAWWTWYATSTALAAATSTATTTIRSPTASAAAASIATTTMHSPTHRRLWLPLRRHRCTARPLFTRPAWPRRTLRSHDDQRALRKLSVNAVVSCSPCAYHVYHYTALALHCIGGGGKHCNDNDSQSGRFSHELLSPTKKIVLPGAGV
jgi:hypothetical protein